MKNLLFALSLGLLSGGVISAEQPAAPDAVPSSKTVAKAGGPRSCANDPLHCRMVVTAEQVKALTPANVSPKDPSAIVMRFDLVEDPGMGNVDQLWFNSNGEAWRFTQASGPLGRGGPLGVSGPLGSNSPLNGRLIGGPVFDPTLARNHGNNWCPATTLFPQSCVYSFGGALGYAGPLNPSRYFNDMYHLGSQVNTWLPPEWENGGWSWGMGSSAPWFQNYNTNLDASGVWGVQGPLGATGPLGALGPLGPLGISRQFAMRTASSGEYASCSTLVTCTTVRKTAWMNYVSGGAQQRRYDLFEVYTKTQAKGMVENDTSFAVDARSEGPLHDDAYVFNSAYDQFVSINVAPTNRDHQQLNLELLRFTGSRFETIARSNSTELVNFIVYRARQGERFQVRVTSPSRNQATYYLFVTGSGFEQRASNITNPNPDVFGPRRQATGQFMFNINGAHQTWQSFQ